MFAWKEMVMHAYAWAMGAAATIGAATRAIGTEYEMGLMPWLTAIRLGAQLGATAHGLEYVIGEAHGLPRVYGDAHGDATPNVVAHGSGRTLALAEMAKANITTAIANCKKNRLTALDGYKIKCFRNAYSYRNGRTLSPYKEKLNNDVIRPYRADKLYINIFNERKKK